MDSTPLLVTFPFDSRRVVTLESKLTICLIFEALFISLDALRDGVNFSEPSFDSAHLLDGGLVGSLQCTERGPKT